MNLPMDEAGRRSRRLSVSRMLSPDHAAPEASPGFRNALAPPPGPDFINRIPERPHHRIPNAEINQRIISKRPAAESPSSITITTAFPISSSLPAPAPQPHVSQRGAGKFRDVTSGLGFTAKAGRREYARATTITTAIPISSSPTGARTPSTATSTAAASKTSPRRGAYAGPCPLQLGLCFYRLRQRRHA